MDDRVKAIFFTALRLDPSEREALAQALLSHLETDLAVAEMLFGRTEDDSQPCAQPTNDILAKYHDS
jgi:hypothetical protein